MLESARLRRLERRIKSSYRIDPSTGCWNGVIGIQPDGYCLLIIHRNNRNINNRIMLHRFMYEKHCGKIPCGCILHHKCGNKRCCNPSHLEVMTAQEHNRYHKLGSTWYAL